MANFNYKFLTPFKFFMLQNFPFIDEDFDAVTNYQMLCKMAEEINKIINSQNSVGKQVEDLTNAFNNLYNYVHNYFDNLDLQDEVNKKLDEMVIDGTLEKLLGDAFKNKIDKTSIEFYGINIKGDANSNCFIVKFNNGKTMFIDCGGTYEWEQIRLAIAEIGITKFDYAILTHYHGDHIGNLSNFFATYDLSNCVFYTQPNNLDWTKVPDLYDNYNTVINILNSHNITPIAPLNNTIITIDDDTYIRFLNNDPSWYDDYYNAISEYRNDSQTGNDFSLVAEIHNRDTVILLTGDIEQTAESKIASYSKKCDLLITPHHSSNRNININYWKTIFPEIALISASKQMQDTYSAVQKELRFLLENGVPTYCLGYSQGNFTKFIGDGYKIYLDTISTTSKLRNNQLYGHVYEVVPMYSTLAEENDISISKIFSNLQPGEILKTVVYTTFLPLFTEIQNIFTGITFQRDGFQAEFYKTQYGNNCFIEILQFNPATRLIAQSHDSGTTWQVSGSSTIAYTSGHDNLITLLTNLPEGSYTMNYTPDSSDKPLVVDGDNYILNINMLQKGSGNILATPRGKSSKACAIGCLINNNLTWKLLTNTIAPGVLINGHTELLNKLNTLTYGNYIYAYTPDADDSPLVVDGDNYVISINILYNNNGVASGNIIATPRGNKAKAPAIGYMINGELTWKLLTAN